MSVADIILSFASKVKTRLTNINTALVAKGQTEVTTLDEVPAKIEAIETSTPDVLSLAMGITKYTDVFTVDGEERANVLVQPSDFSDESKITWSTDTNTTSYFTHSIEAVEGSENGYAAVITPTSSTTYLNKNVFWYTTTVDSSTSEAKSYLVTVRLKASAVPVNYYPKVAVYYRPTNGTASYVMYYSITPSTDWGIYYAIVNIPSGYYLYDMTMSFCYREATYYIDWMAAYDVTGTTFGNMLFAGDATASNVDVRNGEVFYCQGSRKTGSMPDGVLAAPNMYYDSAYPGMVSAYSNVSTAGYMEIPASNANKSEYTGRYSVANLSKENIKKDVEILGIKGTLEPTVQSGGYSGIATIDNYADGRAVITMETGGTTTPSMVAIHLSGSCANYIIDTEARLYYVITDIMIIGDRVFVSAYNMESHEAFNNEYTTTLIKKYMNGTKLIVEIPIYPYLVDDSFNPSYTNEFIVLGEPIHLALYPDDFTCFYIVA